MKDTEFIGMKREDAEAFCEEHQILFRFLRIDDERFFGGADLNFDRLNFEVDAGYITRAAYG